MYSSALIIFVISEKKAFEHFPIGSNRHKKQKLGKGHSNDHSVTGSLGSVSSLVSDNKNFEISANRSILLTLTTMLNI
jgi:hypothetical protein